VVVIDAFNDLFVGWYCMYLGFEPLDICPTITA